MEKDFQRLQRRLAAHLRDPDSNPAPEGVTDDRLQVYRRLFFNNILNFTDNAFPVLSKLLGKDKWHKLNRAFYSQYKCHSPYFVEISEEFLSYLADCEDTAPERSPVYELAHFEREKFAVSVFRDKPDTHDIDPDGDLLQAAPVLSPLVRVLHYRWPVHKADDDERLPDTPADTHLIVWRTPDQIQVRCMECNAVGAALVERMQTRTRDDGATHIKATLNDMGLADNPAAVSGGEAMLEDLREKEIIVGALKTA